MDKANFVGKEGMVKEETQGSLAMTTPIRETQAEKGALLTVPKIAPPLPKRTEKEARRGSKQFGENNYN